MSSSSKRALYQPFYTISATPCSPSTISDLHSLKRFRKDVAELDVAPSRCRSEMSPITVVHRRTKWRQCYCLQTCIGLARWFGSSVAKGEEQSEDHPRPVAFVRINDDNEEDEGALSCSLALTLYCVVPCHRLLMMSGVEGGGTGPDGSIAAVEELSGNDERERPRRQSLSFLLNLPLQSNTMDDSDHHPRTSLHPHLTPRFLPSAPSPFQLDQHQHHRDSHSRDWSPVPPQHSE